MLYYSQNRDKKGSLMSRLPAFFMAALLLFSTIPVSLAQQNFIRANANADAIRDADRDMKKVWWFMFGLAGSTAGFVAGCVGGCFIGATEVDDSTYCIIPATLVLGVLAMPAAVYLYPHTVNPPPERLLGKSPEYVQTYAQAYKSKTVSLRRKMVTAGSLSSNLGIIGTMLLLIISNL